MTSLPHLCDVISIHVPGKESNRHMIDEKAFSKMKDDVIFINTARGMVVDSEALIQALESGGNLLREIKNTLDSDIYAGSSRQKSLLISVNFCYNLYANAEQLYKIEWIFYYKEKVYEKTSSINDP